jgi:tetratricopeptide (TPR) repeat protein
MSPEQGRGERAGPASDIYSLAVVLYELLTGRVPFDADTPLAIVVKHIQTPLPPPRAFRPDMPEELERVLLKALAKEPRDRFLDAGAFGAAVRAACGAPERTSLQLDTAPPTAPSPTSATRVIDELQATRLPTSAQPPATSRQATPAPPQTAHVRADAVAVAPAASVSAAQPKRAWGSGKTLLLGAGALFAAGLIALVAFAAGGVAVFRGLGEAGALVVPTEFAVEATAAAARGEPFPYLDGTALPETVAEAIAAADEACSAPGCSEGGASEAVTTLDAAIAAEPESAPLYAARARVYSWWDPFTYAAQIEADVAAALERDPSNATAYLARGELAAAEGDAAAAREAFDRSLALGPSAAAYVARATLLAGAPDYYDRASPSREQVIADATAALALEPQHVRALLLRGDAYGTSDQPEQAAADYSAALDEEPENYDALMGRANVARYSTGDHEAALADYAAAAEAAPENPDPLRQRVSLLAELGEPEAARADADALVALVPNDPESYLMRGFLAIAARRFPAAAEDFDRALLLAGETSLAARYGRGKVLLEQGDAAAALPDLEAAVADLDNLGVDWYSFFLGRQQVLVDLVRAYASLDRPRDALAVVDRAIAVDSNWHLPYLLRARLRAPVDPVAARADLRQALELAGDDAERAEIEAELRRLP